MTHRGFSHIGLSTLDLDKTREFYEGVLGFKPVVADTIKIKEGGPIFDTSFSMSGAVSLSPFWNQTEFQTYRQSTMQASTAGLGSPPASIISLSRPVHPPRLPRNATRCAPRESRPRTSSITVGRGPSTSRIPTACLSSIAAWCATSPRTTRRCRNALRSRVARSSSMTRSAAESLLHDHLARCAMLNAGHRERGACTVGAEGIACGPARARHPHQGKEFPMNNLTAYQQTIWPPGSSTPTLNSCSKMRTQPSPQ